MGLRCALTSLFLVVAGASTGCGGSGVEGPRVVGAHEDTGCPSADDALANARVAFGISAPAATPGTPGTNDLLAELRPVLTRILVTDGGLRVLIQGVAALFEDMDAVTLRRLLDGVNPSTGLGGLTPHLVETLRYLDGSSTFVPGPHDEPLAAVHAILDICEPAATVATLRRLLELEVTDGEAGPSLATDGPPGSGDRAWLAAVLESARVVVEDPALREVVTRIELEDDDGSGTIQIGKDAFQLLAHLIAANLAAPELDPSFTRQLIEDVVMVRIEDDAARAKLDALLDLVLLVTDPTADVFPQVQSLMACLDEADSEAAIPGMLFDWLTVEELSVDIFLADLQGFTGTGNADELRKGLVTILGAFEKRPNVAQDVVRVLASLLAPETVDVSVRTLLALQGRGVVRELALLADAIAACHPS